MTSHNPTAYAKSSNQPHVTVCVLNWNRREETLRCLQSVREQTYQNFDLLVVDNASSDGSPEAIRSEFPEARIEVFDRNYGCPGGRNRGIALADSEYVFCPDNDGVLHRAALSKAVEAMRQDERIGIVVGHVRPFRIPDEIDTNYDPTGDQKGHFLGTFFATVALYRKSIFQAVGGYPDNYIYAGEEDYLLINLIRNGYHAWYEPEAILWHKESKMARAAMTEFVNRQVNGLANRVMFWPAEFTALWMFRDFLRSPLQAVKAGMFFAWLKTWPNRWVKTFLWAVKRRNPIDRKTFKLIFKLTWKDISSLGDTNSELQSYWHSLFSVIKNGR